MLIDIDCREQAKGHTGNNIVTVLMKERGIDLQTASDFVGEYFGELMSRFTEAQTRLPSWGESVDSDVAKYLEGAGCWVRGNIE